jgi:hypothetical protein
MQMCGQGDAGRVALNRSLAIAEACQRSKRSFCGVSPSSFAIEAAASVVGDEDIRSFEVIEIVANLSQKSLVATDISNDVTYHYMHDTTRTYALEKLIESGELQKFCRRHAEYYWGLLERIGDEWESRPAHLADVDNIRAALEWCFGVNGDREIAVRLAAAAAPVFLMLSLVRECHRWSERALTALGDATRGGSEEMHLQASLGVSSMQMCGQGDAGRVALNRSLAIAEARGDALNQVGLLGMLSMFHTRDGDFKNRAALRKDQPISRRHREGSGRCSLSPFHFREVVSLYGRP